MNTFLVLLCSLSYMLSAQAEAPSSQTAISTPSKYETPNNENFVSLDKCPAQFEKKWNKDQVSVQLKRTITYVGHRKSGTALRFQWKGKNFEALLKAETNGKAEQNWDFGNAKAILYKTQDGARRQFWNFGGKSRCYYEEKKEDGGYISMACNVKDDQLRALENEINSFCQENQQKYFPNDCIIYDKNTLEFLQKETSARYTSHENPIHTFQSPHIVNFRGVGDIRSGVYKMMYQGRRGEIHLQREEDGTWSLKWNIDGNTVNIIRKVDDQVEQTWIIDRTTIKLVRRPDGSSDQYWDVDGAKFEYHQFADGHTEKSGSLYRDDMLKYEMDMKIWCQQNKKFFPTAYCFIFKRPVIP